MSPREDRMSDVEMVEEKVTVADCRVEERG